MPDRSILVTGARGFVGRHLVAAIAESGMIPVGLDLPGPGPEADPDWLVHRRSLGAAPATAPAELAELLAADRYHAIIHLAGQSSAGASFGDPAGTVAANLLGTLELLEALRLLQAGGAPVPRLLAVGSSEEYGLAAAAGRPCREDDPLRPASPYATSKAAATQLCGQYACSFGLPVLATRSFNHTGPGQDERFVFPSFAAQIAAIEAGRAEAVLRTGDCSPARDFLDVRDVVQAYLALVARGEAGHVYNVCSGSSLTIREGLEILLGLSGTAIEVEPDPARMRPVEIPSLVGDPTKIHEATDWRPRFHIEQTLRDLLERARRSTA